MFDPIEEVPDLTKINPERIPHNSLVECIDMDGDTMFVPSGLVGFPMVSALFDGDVLHNINPHLLVPTGRVMKIIEEPAWALDC